MSTLYLQYFQSFLSLFQLFLSPQPPEIHNALVIIVVKHMYAHTIY